MDAIGRNKRFLHRVMDCHSGRPTCKCDLIVLLLIQVDGFVSVCGTLVVRPYDLNVIVGQTAVVPCRTDLPSSMVSCTYRGNKRTSGILEFRSSYQSLSTKTLCV